MFVQQKCIGVNHIELVIIIIITNLISDIYCATSSDRIVFPDEAAEWDKYNAIQAQAAGVVEPVYRQQNSIPTTKDYEFITQFTLNLFKESKPNIPTENLVLCPILVALLLSQLQSAAIDQTKDELTKLIGNLDPYIIDRLISDLSTTSHRNELILATSILAGEGISLNKTFVDVGHTRNVDIMNVDFNHPILAANKANQWIATKTKNNILNAIDPNTLNGIRLMLMNVLYFRGYWRYPFNETVQDQFHSTPYYSKSIKYMKQIAKLRANDKIKTKSGGIEFTWIELPYEGNGYCLVVLIPNERHRLDDLIQHLSTQDFLLLMDQLDEPFKRQVSLKMPKFTARTSYSFVPTLQKLGLQKIFTGDSKLPYLTTNNEHLVVGDLMQKSLLNVDEIGTVATAATSVGVIALSITPNLQKLSINIDQPFLVTIFDKRNQMPLFIGKINDP